jgi:hypothetical protein
MSSESHDVIKEYLVVFLYLLLLVGQGVGEAAWLKKHSWASWAKALLFSWLTNLVGFCIGFFLLFVSVGVTLMLAWDGSINKLPFKGNEAGVVLVLVVLLLPILLALIKRLLLALFKMQEGGRAWLFALLSSLCFWLLPLGLTGLVTVLLWRFV